MVVGQTNSYGNGENDVYLVKTNLDGVRLWDKTYGGFQDDSGFCVQQTNDGGYIILGQSYSCCNGERDIYLIKTNDIGHEEWSRSYGGIESDFGMSIEQTSDGGYVVVGSTNSYGNGESDVYIIKTSSTGGIEWVETFGGTNNDNGYSIVFDDSGYIILGSSSSYSSGDYDFYLIKMTNPEGVVSITETSKKNSDRKLQKTVDLLGRGTKNKTHLPIIEIYDDGSVEKRIIFD